MGNSSSAVCGCRDNDREKRGVKVIAQKHHQPTGERVSAEPFNSAKDTQPSVLVPAQSNDTRNWAYCCAPADPVHPALEVNSCLSSSPGHEKSDWHGEMAQRRAPDVHWKDAQRRLPAESEASSEFWPSNKGNATAVNNLGNQRRRGVTFNPQRATNAAPMHASPTRFRGVRTEGAGAEGGLGSEGIGIHTYSGALEAPRGLPAFRVIGERPYSFTPERPVAWQDQSHEPKTHRALPIAPPRPSFTPRSHQHNATTAPTYGSESSVTGRTDVGVMLASSPTATLFTTADVALQQTPCQKRPTTVSKETYYSVKPSPSCDHSSRPSSSPQAARAGERKTQRPLYFANELPGAAAKVLDRRSEQDAEIATITGEVDRLTNLLQKLVHRNSPVQHQ